MKIKDKTFLIAIIVFITLGLINITFTVGSAKATQKVKTYIDNNEYQLRNYYINTIENIRVVKIKPPLTK